MRITAETLRENGFDGDAYFIDLQDRLTRDVGMNVPLAGSLHTLGLGATGLSCNQTNVIPRTCRQYVDCYERGDLAVRIGPIAARQLFALCIAGAFVFVVPICIRAPWAALGFFAIPLAIQPLHLVLTRDDPPGLVAGLVATVRLTIVLAALVSLGLVVS